MPFDKSISSSYLFLLSWLTFCDFEILNLQSLYSRDHERPGILSAVTESDIPNRHLYLTVKVSLLLFLIFPYKVHNSFFGKIQVLTDQDIQKHGGFDLCNFEDPRFPITPLKTMKVLKRDTVQQFRDTMAAEMKLPPEKIRPWD